MDSLTAGSGPTRPHSPAGNDAQGTQTTHAPVTHARGPRARTSGTQGWQDACRPKPKPSLGTTEAACAHTCLPACSQQVKATAVVCGGAPTQPSISTAIMQAHRGGVLCPQQAAGAPLSTPAAAASVAAATPSDSRWRHSSPEVPGRLPLSLSFPLSPPPSGLMYMHTYCCCWLAVVSALSTPSLLPAV